jgi:predicted DNA-binding protein YlxM (UPF0122 family)
MKISKGITEESGLILKERTELSLLFDFYSELLDEHKKDIFGEYIMNDLSLAEISENEGISRQGVHDIVKRTSLQLREYEEKLGLVKKFRELQQLSRKIDSVADGLLAYGNEEAAGRLKNISKAVKETI